MIGFHEQIETLIINFFCIYIRRRQINEQEEKEKEREKEQN